MRRTVPFALMLLLAAHSLSAAETAKGVPELQGRWKLTAVEVNDRQAELPRDLPIWEISAVPFDVRVIERQRTQRVVPAPRFPHPSHDLDVLLRHRWESIPRPAPEREERLCRVASAPAFA